MKSIIAGLTVLAVGVCVCRGDIVTGGLIPKTPTFYVNTNYFNNGGGEAPGVDIAANGNVIIGWEDDGGAISDFESVFSVFNANGGLITPQTVITSYVYGTTWTNTFLSYFRSDNTATPGFTGFGPKIKANRFCNGIGHGSSTDVLGAEVPELAAINTDAGGTIGSGAGSFPAVQIMNNDGTPIKILTGGSDADLEPAGTVRIADWDYLANGNIVIVGDSRQNDDLVNKFGGPAPGNHGTYRVIKPDGTEVKAYSLLSSSSSDIYNIWHGVGVTANGFAVRFNAGGSSKIRLFDNTGTPTSANINLATLTGHPEAGGGDRGDGTGFHGNGKDAYVYVDAAAGGVLWVTVINADGTLRWSRGVAEAGETIVATRVDGAIAPDGRVIAIWDSRLQNATGGVTNRLVQARMFNANGTPVGGRFVVSDWETPQNGATIYTSEIPRVAWRNNAVVMAWLSHNSPETVADPTSPGVAELVAARFYSAALVPQATTFYVNTNYFNNGGGEAPGVDIAANGNVIIGWEDDGGAISDFESVFSVFNANGGLITPQTVITSYVYGTTWTNTFLSYFRSDNTATPGFTGFGPKIKANRFGNGIGHGSSTDVLGAEVPELAAINTDAGGAIGSGAGSFPAVQIMNNDGTPIKILTGGSDADLEPAGTVRIADWDYLANGNIVIVGDSRQNDDLVNKFGGPAPGNHGTYRVIKPDGTEVKAYSLLSSSSSDIYNIWHGVGVTANGF